MTRRRVTVLLLAVVAVTAGCNVGPGGETPTITPAPGVDTPTATPERSPTGAGSSDEGDLPPGVTARGLTDPDALFGADARALAYTGYAAESWMNGSREGESGKRRGPPAPGWTHRVARVAAGGEPALVTVTRRIGDREERREYWRHGNRTLERVSGTERDGATVSERTGALGGNPALGPAVRGLLVAGDYANVTVRRRGGDTYAVLRAEDTSRAGEYAPPNLTDYEGRLVADQRGRIRSATVRVEIDGRFTYRVRYELRQVGDVRVESPDWVATDPVQPPNSSNLSRR